VRIATSLDNDGTIDQIVTRAKNLRDVGFTDLWSSQIFGPDTLTALAIVGRELPTLNLGTSVVPIQPRHPSMLAAQARTVQSAIGGHLSLGIGLSHQMIVENMWGLSFERPATYMREYVEALAPMLRGEAVLVKGERVSTFTTDAVGVKDVVAPSLLIAALGPVMLELAGSQTDGTVLWMTGRKTVATHIAPTINAAAARAGRPSPRIVCGLPIVVTKDVAAARESIDTKLAFYPSLPSYAAMMEREGATMASELALIGSREQVTDQLGQLAEAGVTEFQAAVAASGQERDDTLELLASLV